MNSQLLNDDLVISTEYIYTVSKREKRFRSIMLDRRTVSLVRAIDGYRRLSRIIIDYADMFMRHGGYDEYAFKLFKQALAKLYGQPEFFVTSVTIEAVSRLKEIKGRLGLMSLADAFDLIVFYYINKKYCSNVYTKLQICQLIKQ